MATISHITIVDGGDYLRRPTVTFKGATPVQAAAERGFNKQQQPSEKLTTAHGPPGFHTHDDPKAAKGKTGSTPAGKAFVQEKEGPNENLTVPNPDVPHEETELDRAAHGKGAGMNITDQIAAQDPTAEAEAMMVGRKVVKVELRAAAGKDFDGTPEVVFDPPGAKAVCVMNVAE